MVFIAGIALLFGFEIDKVQILIAQLVSLAKAIAAYVGFVPATSYGPPQFLTRTIATYWSTVEWYGVQVAELLILNLTMIFLLIRVRRPRPPAGALIRQPGTVAGLAVIFALTFVVGWMHFLYFGRLIDGAVTPIAVGGTVAVAWTCLALFRRWEAEPSWVDRMGRILGAAAILVGAITFLVFGLVS
jgi:hypothetical protein